MDSIGYTQVRTCLDQAGFYNCEVTNLGKTEDGETLWVSIAVSRGVDPALVMEALAKADLLYTEEPQIAVSRDEDRPLLDLRCGIGNRLLFLDMN